VWGHGEEDDRIGPTRRRLGPHAWVTKVERFVSLAAPNRGWRVELTREADPLFSAASVVYSHATRLSGTAQLLHGIVTGSPFIANMRLQWIRIARRLNDRMPLVVHLVGKRDELVSLDDSLDLAAAPGMLFKTLPALNHREIGHNIRVGPERRLSETAEAIAKALVASRTELETGFADPFVRKENPDVTRVVYVMHGIRDAGYWTDYIRERVAAALGDRKSRVALPDVDYNRIPMAPFLLYWDRQRHVRAFMDQYTDDFARYPNLKDVDFFGHSNGTYIAASALQRYRTLRLRNVLFAGSVVPSHFNWTEYTSSEQVKAVRNIVADTDWVVALFPQLFELVSRTVLGAPEPRPGPFDIGAAGFRGFVKAAKGGPVQDILFLSGDHGTAVDIAGSDPVSVARLGAIARFLALGDDSELRVFATSTAQNGMLELFSNMAWIVWLSLAAGLIVGGRLAARQGRMWLTAYGAALLAILWTV
jgi:pimeloyl-ACP methyl ester carboxylesterase